MINKETYEEYFLLYTDGELDEAARAEVERFVEENPELKRELELLAQAVFVADENIVFEDKEVLYKKEKDRAAVIFFGWRRIAVAAAVLLFLGVGGWMYLDKTNSPDKKQEGVENNNLAVVVPEKKDIPQTKDVEIKTNAPMEKHPEKTEVASPVKPAAKHLPGKIRADEKRSAPVSNPIIDAHATEELTLDKPAKIINQVAMNDHSDDKINIAVNARDLTLPTAPVQNTIHYVDEDGVSGNNRIYFANTSISKRNSLRVVFRKASRIIDRITTLQ